MLRFPPLSLKLLARASLRGALCMNNGARVAPRGAVSYAWGGLPWLLPSSVSDLLLQQINPALFSVRGLLNI